MRARSGAELPTEASEGKPMGSGRACGGVGACLRALGLECGGLGR